MYSAVRHRIGLLYIIKKSVDRRENGKGRGRGRRRRRDASEDKGIEINVRAD